MRARISLNSFVSWVSCLVLASCGGAPVAPPVVAPSTQQAQALPPEPVPTGRLPRDVRPLHYAIELHVDPRRDRFTGVVDIDLELDRPRQELFLHVNGPQLAEVTIALDQASIPARVETVGPEGLSRLRAATTIPAGRARLHIVYDAPFGRQLAGLYRVDTGGRSYAFTQFEATSAREAFPCFDDPGFKTPFDVTLVVKQGDAAIANTRVVAEEREGDERRRVRFATTEALPTYLVAWAVGELDIVDGPDIPPSGVRSRPIPFRGVATHGRGQELAYAMQRTPAILTALESYFGIAYPYDKLDILAVPDFDAGAMENAGAVTFREWLLLVDPAHATEQQKRAFTSVMAHELAHQWFGDLVTMAWWDDLWLNEAFATWMAARIAAEVEPSAPWALDFAGGVQGAMAEDSLASTRRIRQAIETPDDIHNAFDSITYSKGGGVIAMFESYLGPALFQRGIRAYLESHRFGNATVDDLMHALSAAADTDVGTPFRTFLDQPGVPLVTATVVCDESGAHVDVTQTRSRPIGSAAAADTLWQVPVCIRYFAGGAAHTKCELVTEASASIALPEGCPTWILPNADANGYYRFVLGASDLTKLRRAGLSVLTPRERLAFADAMDVAFESATLPTADVLAALPMLASAEERTIAQAPMEILNFLSNHVVTDAARPSFEAWVRRLYAPAMRRLGLRPRAGEPAETGMFRAALMGFLWDTAHDPAATRELVRLGRAYADSPESVSPELANNALAAAVRASDAAFFDRLLEKLTQSDDAAVRGRIIGALSSTLDPTLAARARELALDPRLRQNEAMMPLWTQSGQRQTRAATWDWFRTHYDVLLERISTNRGGYTPWLASGFCDEARSQEVEAFFSSRIARLPGGPRNLAQAREVIGLCAARKNAHEDARF